MPVRDYTINYRGSNAELLAATLQLSAAMRQLDAQATALTPKLKGFATGSSTPITAAAKSAATLTANLENVARSATLAQNSLNGIGPVATGAAGGAGQLNQSLAGLSGTLIGLNEIKRVVGQIGDALRDARDYARETGEENLKLYKTLRETANLGEKNKPDAQVAAGVMSLMLESGMDQGEARKFAQEFRGSIYAARTKGNLAPTVGTPAQMEHDIEVMAARTAVAKGVDPGTMANLASAIATTQKVTSPAQVAAQISLSVDAMNEGVGSLSDMTKQVLHARGSLVAAGFAQSLPDVAALVSGMSINDSVGRTGTRLESMAATIAQATAGKDADKLAAIGIGPENRDFVDILRKLKPVVDASKQPGGGGPIAALAALGIGDKRAQAEIIKSVGELPVYEKLIARNRAVLGDTARGVPARPERVAAAATKLTAGLDEFKAADATGQFADAEMRSAEFLRGEQTRRLQVLRKSAAARLIGEEKIKTAPAALEGMLKTGFGVSTWLGGKTGEELAIDQRMAGDVLGRARARGLSTAQIRRAAPDLEAVAAGGADRVGDARLGQQVQLLEAVMAGGKAPAAVMDTMRRQGGAGVATRIRALAGEPEPAPAGGGAVGDGPVQQAQLRVLQNIERQLQGGGPAPVGAPIGPAPLPGGPVRIGQ